MEVRMGQPHPAPRSPRWQRRPDDRPRQILEAASRVFGKRGLHRATLDDVAREAGITKGTIYLYFPSKADLFVAMLKAGITAVIPTVDAVEEHAAPSLEGGLAAVGRELYRFLSSPAYLAMFRTVVSEAAQFPEVAALVYREGVLTANRRLAAVIQAGIRTGACRGVDPMIAARAFVGMFLVFAVSQRLLGGERIYPIADEAIVKTVTDLFLNGLLTSQRSHGGGHTHGGRRPPGAPRGRARSRVKVRRPNAAPSGADDGRHR
jgi:AcrR family transcriptional regulator